MVKNPPTNVGDMGSIPGLGRFSGEGNGNLLQYSCQENPMDRGACWVFFQSMGLQSVRHDRGDLAQHSTDVSITEFLF